MSRISSWSAYGVVVLVALLMLDGLLPVASLQAQNTQTVLFSADFENLPEGQLTEPKPVEVGKIVPGEGVVAIVNTDRGKALAVDASGGVTSDVGMETEEIPQSSASPYPYPYPYPYPSPHSSPTATDSVPSATATDPVHTATTIPAPLSTDVPPAEASTPTATDTATPLPDEQPIVPTGARAARFQAGKDTVITIDAEFGANRSDTGGGSFDLLPGSEEEASGSFNLLTFGSNGRIERDGRPVGLNYSPDVPVVFRGSFNLTTQRGTIEFTSGGQRVVEQINLSDLFTESSQFELQGRAPGSSRGRYVTYNIRIVVFQPDVDPNRGNEPVPGAPGTTGSAQIAFAPDGLVEEVAVGETEAAVALSFSIANSGATANDTVLSVNYDPSLVLADVRFLEGAGYVISIAAGRSEIGVGQQNRLRKGEQVRLRILLTTPAAAVERQVPIELGLRYRDGGGGHELGPLKLLVTIPPAPSSAPPVTPTPGTQSYVPLPRLAVELIDPRFQARWQADGGLEIVGLPLTLPITSSAGIVTQYFERARAEYHPSLASTSDGVLYGLLAVELGYSEPPAPVVDSSWYMTPTGHLIGESFRTFWQNRGGLALFGYPISEARQENGLLVQYFERVRMELHPELAGTPYQIQLGLLGEMQLQRDPNRGSMEANAKQ